MATEQIAPQDPACCVPVEPQTQPELQGLEGPEADDELAKLAKAIGHPARVRILRMLSQKEARVCSQIVGELPLAQSTVSEHLRILKDAGLIRSKPRRPSDWVLHQLQRASKAEGSCSHYLKHFSGLLNRLSTKGKRNRHEQS
jgi:DNA-binding transcriptional ArsR family regulator